MSKRIKLQKEKVSLEPQPDPKKPKDLPLDREAGIVGQKVEKKDEIRDRKGHLEYLV